MDLYVIPGIFCGGYHYSLKMYTYERVRSRNFARTWGFVQCSQAVPIAIGVPLSGNKVLQKCERKKRATTFVIISLYAKMICLKHVNEVKNPTAKPPCVDFPG